MIAFDNQVIEVEIYESDSDGDIFYDEPIVFPSILDRIARRSRRVGRKWSSAVVKILFFSVEQPERNKESFADRLDKVIANSLTSSPWFYEDGLWLQAFHNRNSQHDPDWKVDYF